MPADPSELRAPAITEAQHRLMAESWHGSALGVAPSHRITRASIQDELARSVAHHAHADRERRPMRACRISRTVAPRDHVTWLEPGFGGFPGVAHCAGSAPRFRDVAPTTVRSFVAASVI